MKYIILVSGRMQSGKNQIAEYLKEAFNEHNLKVGFDLFASSLKDGCKEDFKVLADYLNSETEKIKSMVNMLFDLTRYPERTAVFEHISYMLDQMKLENHNWYEDKTTVSRMILQIYGTEIFRQRVDNDWWAKQTKNRVLNVDNDVTIITDARFENELQTFIDVPNDCKVYSLRVQRTNDNDSKIARHESETALDDYTAWDYIVENNGTLDDLRASAKVIADDILIKPEVSGLLNKIYSGL